MSAWRRLSISCWFHHKNVIEFRDYSWYPTISYDSGDFSWIFRADKMPIKSKTIDRTTTCAQHLKIAVRWRTASIYIYIYIVCCFITPSHLKRKYRGNLGEIIYRVINWNYWIYPSRNIKFGHEGLTKNICRRVNKVSRQDYNNKVLL